MSSPTLSAAPYPELGAIISRVQSRFIRAAVPIEVFDPLLKDLLEVTCSEYGFIGEVRHDEQGKIFLRILELTDISWNDHTRLLVQQHQGGKPLEFHNLDTLFGVALKTECQSSNRKQPTTWCLPAGESACRPVKVTPTPPSPCCQTQALSWYTSATTR